MATCFATFDLRSDWHDAPDVVAQVGVADLSFDSPFAQLDRHNLDLATP